MAVSLFVLPFAGALAVVAAGLLRRGLARPLTLAVLGAQTALTAAAALRVVREGPLRARLGGWEAPLGIEWSLGGPAAIVAVLVSAVAFLALAAAKEAARTELAGREVSFHACVLLLVSGLAGMLATADLFNFFVHLEVASLSAYALTAAGPGAPRAALRYLVTGSLGASLYLLGVGHLYAATGSLGLADVGARMAEAADPRLSTLGVAFIIVGLAVKMGLFPLHGWAPEAYARCPAPAAAVMAPLVTKVAAFSLLRLLAGLYGPEAFRHEVLLSSALQWGGAMAAVAGAVGAARQTELRRLFAWSSVSQAGLAALGIGLGSAAAVTGAFLAVVADVAAKAVVFSAAMVLEQRFDIRRVDQLPRTRGRARWTSASVAIAGLSLVGLPPFPGFFGKWYVLGAALEEGRLVLAASVVVASLGAAVYVFRLFEGLFLSRPTAENAAAEGPWSAVGATALLAAGIAAAGLAAGPIAGLVARSGLAGGP